MVEEVGTRDGEETRKHGGITSSWAAPLGDTWAGPGTGERKEGKLNAKQGKKFGNLRVIRPYEYHTRRNELPSDEHAFL